MINLKVQAEGKAETVRYSGIAQAPSGNEKNKKMPSQASEEVPIKGTQLACQCGNFSAFSDNFRVKGDFVLNNP